MRENLESFHLDLSDGQSWKFSAVEEAQEWISKFAGILGLKKSESSDGKRIIFVRNWESMNDYSKIGASKEALKIQYFPLASWFFSDEFGPKFIYIRDREDILCDIGYQEIEPIEYLRMQHSLIPVYNEVQKKGGFPIHGALMVMNEMGAVLAGPGGSGKTTCCSRLPPPWQSLCDDETLIVRTKYGAYHAHPFPTWKNCFLDDDRQVWDVQHYVPLNAIFYLEQSGVDELVPLGKGMSVFLIFRLACQACRRFWLTAEPAEARLIHTRLFQNAHDLAATVPVFRLRVSLKGRFWEKMEEVLHRKEQIGIRKTG